MCKCTCLHTCTHFGCRGWSPRCRKSVCVKYGLLTNDKQVIDCSNFSMFDSIFLESSVLTLQPRHGFSLLFPVEREKNALHSCSLSFLYPPVTWVEGHPTGWNKALIPGKSSIHPKLNVLNEEASLLTQWVAKAMSGWYLIMMKCWEDQNIKQMDGEIFTRL